MPKRKVIVTIDPAEARHMLGLPRASASVRPELALG